MASDLHWQPGMAQVTNIAAGMNSTPSGTASGTPGAPTQTTGIDGLLAALVATSSRSAANGPQGASDLARGVAGSLAGASAGTLAGGLAEARSSAAPLQALWARVFDFYQHGSQPDINQSGSLTGQALLGGQPPEAASAAIASTATSSGAKLSGIAATLAAASATGAMPAKSAAAATLEKATLVGQAATMQRSAGTSATGTAQKPRPEANKQVAGKGAAAVGKSVAPPSAPGANSAVVSVPVSVPVPVLVPVLVPVALFPSTPQTLATLSKGDATRGIGLGTVAAEGVQTGGSAPADWISGFGAGLIGGQFATQTAIAEGAQSPSGQALGMQDRKPVVENAALGIKGVAADATLQTAQAIQTVQAEQSAALRATTQRFPGQWAGAAGDAASLASSGSPTTTAQVASSVAHSASAAAPQWPQPALTQSASTQSSAGQSPAALSPAARSAASPGTGLGVGLVSGQSSAQSPSTDALAASKTGAAIHPGTSGSGTSISTGAFAGAIAVHAEVSPVAVAGATGLAPMTQLAGQASGPATGHAAPVLHPGQVFESLDATVHGWNPSDARPVSGGASLSVGYQDARLGYVELQARQVAGSVQATLVPSSEAARHALEGQLGSLGGWLAQRATPVDRLVVAASAASMAASDHGGAMHSGGADSSGSARDQRETGQAAMSRAAQQGFSGGSGGRDATGENVPAPSAMQAVGMVAGAARTGAGVGSGVGAGTVSSESANRLSMRASVSGGARLGVGQTISVRV